MRLFEPRPGEKLLTVTEAANVSGYARVYVNCYLIQNDIIPVCHQQGDPRRRRLVREADILAWRDRKVCKHRPGPKKEAFLQWAEENRELLVNAKYGETTILWEKFQTDTGVTVRLGYFIDMISRFGYRRCSILKARQVIAFIRTHPFLLYVSAREGMDTYFRLEGQEVRESMWRYALYVYRKSLVSHPDDMPRRKKPATRHLDSK